MSADRKENIPPSKKAAKDSPKIEIKPFISGKRLSQGKHLKFKTCKQMIKFNYKDVPPFYFLKRPYNPTYYGAKYIKALDGVREQLRELVSSKISCRDKPNLFLKRFEMFRGLCLEYQRWNKAAVNLHENREQKVFLHLELEDMPFWIYYSKNEKLQALNMIILESDSAGRSWVCYSNHTAKSNGVKPGMSLRDAKLLCSQIVEVPLDTEEYFSFSKKFFEGLGGFADNIDVVNFDEAMIDVSSIFHNSNGIDILDHYTFCLRMCVNYYTNGAGCFVGLGHNRFLAVLASRQAKMRNLKTFYFQDTFVEGVMMRLPVEELLISRFTVSNLRDEFPLMYTCGDMQKLCASIIEKFGPDGIYLNRLARGDFDSEENFAALFRNIIYSKTSTETELVRKTMSGLVVNGKKGKPKTSIVVEKKRKKSNKK